MGAHKRRASPTSMPADGRARVVIEGVEPEIDCGRYPIKRTVGERVFIAADVFTDGHDLISCALLHKQAGARRWSKTPMTLLENDRWGGSFTVEVLGRYRCCIMAWVDHFRSWRRDLKKRVAAGQDVAVDLQIGAGMAKLAAARADGAGGRRLAEIAGALEDARRTPAERIEMAMGEELSALMARWSERQHAAKHDRELEVEVDRERARFSAWYEMFPRSASEKPGRHGTFRDVAARLPYIAGMGFDVLYLPPIHPIGVTHRKGRNNAVRCERGEPGSPWAIGAKEGGHTAIHPELGSATDFRRLVKKAEEHGIEVALDIAFQCSPDHPAVREHPEWFRKRPDGTVQYAENPPKKYQDIYPFDFETEQWESLWQYLRDVVLHWIGEGVKIFRVDNPHTKPFAFWEWLIGEVKRDHPEAIFLAEAFTRPKVMKRLAKLGFSQSYTYFAWKNSKWELTEYFTELTATKVREYYRPNPWPNTPDILNEFLQFGGRPAFAARLALAATLSASYGIYGPPFELCEATPREPGSEEYLDSEKYQIRAWDLDHPDSLRDTIALVNRIRRSNPALQFDRSLRFHHVNNDELICYSKRTQDWSNVILVVVNLDPSHRQSGWVDLDMDELGLDPQQPYQVEDLLGVEKYLWHGAHNYVELDPEQSPAHIFLLRPQVRTASDFEHYM
ncbi:MAG: alpha-1,4-glucan--maltose-1-phosphate maltosyltransferase [Phycisphaeraceae bacterium]|nr:MAG: alpha-1,4-glucan--maltose-1-phosphate maltosyltransferase [Phycisphaeraceae bacterium]